MAYIRDQVFVLKTAPFREHDVWVSMYGREHGKMEAVARGIRSWRAKQRGHLEPLTLVDVMVAKGVTFDKLAVAHAVSAQTDLRQRLGAMVMIGSFAHLLDSLTRPGISDPELFYLMEELLGAWRSSQREPTPERTRLLYAAAASKLLHILGYGPAHETSRLSDEANKLLAMLPQMPLGLTLSITAPTSVFNEVSAMVEGALEDAPVRDRPHGPATIVSLLT